MCGICGVIALAGDPVEEKLVVAMRDTLGHRGPDEAGTWLSPDCRVGLGHRRLSIIDLKSGRQPMTNEDGAIWLVFNGEIYNHRELRGVLEARGHRYRTMCDSESIIHAYEEYGDRCPEHLRGEFAFALWDSRRRELFAARDRIGVKPFYYAQTPRVFVFGSELKALLAHPGIEKRLCLPAIGHYLAFYSTVAPYTPFQGLSKLPAAHAFRLKQSGDLKIWRYWQPTPQFARTPGTPEIEDSIYRLLRSATEDRMISDVPFGVFLSGGIDSAANLGLMTEILTQPVNSFTIGYQDDLEFNELAAARATANRFGAAHHEVVIGRDEFWEAVLDSPHYADEPTGTPECIPLYHLSRYTRANGVKVVQVGEGSDELFGYPGWPRLLRIGRRISRIARFLPARRATLLLASRAAALAGKYHYSTFLDWYARGTSHFQTSMPYPRYFREMMYGPVLRQQDPEEEMEGQLGRLAVTPSSMGPLDDYQSLLWFELTHRLPENILARVDRMTMSSSIEARVPFLDHRLVDYTFFLPERMRFEHGAKSLLKGAIRDRVLPSSILDRPKRGFGTPVRRWINEDLFSETRRLILNCALVKYGILDPVGIESMIDYSRTAYRHNLPGQRSVYQLLLLCRWYDLHF